MKKVDLGIIIASVSLVLFILFSILQFQGKDRYISIGITLVLFIFIIIWFLLRRRHKGRKKWRRKIEDVIRKAINEEFWVYRQVPEIKLESLGEYFTHNGPAMKRIELIVKRTSKRGWTLCNLENPSTNKLIEIEILCIKKDIAEVNTREYWYLRWYNPKTDKYPYIYNETNGQKYYLKKVEGRWLIEKNVYPPLSSKPLNIEGSVIG